MAKALVRWASRWWQASYQATERERENDLRGWGSFWTRGAKRVDAFAIPLAAWLDRRAAGQQMVEECWWG